MEAAATTNLLPIEGALQERAYMAIEYIEYSLIKLFLGGIIRIIPSSYGIIASSYVILVYDGFISN
jgi:hypothetical protein